VLVNECGELGTDGEMVAGEHEDMVELIGGPRQTPTSWQ